jgi:hypothetical protein
LRYGITFPIISLPIQPPLELSFCRRNKKYQLYGLTK